MRSMWIVCCLSIACLLFPIASASATPSWYGYALALGGVSYISDSIPDVGYAGISLVATPFSTTVLDPALYLEARFALRNGLYDLHDLDLGLNLTMFKTLHHPFDFLMPINPTVYAPALRIALRHNLHDDHPLRVMAGLSIFRLLEKDTWNEWLSPFVIFNPYIGELEGWGITLWRFTYLKR